VSRNEESVDEGLQKRNEWLERENKRLRQDAKDWREYGLQCEERTARLRQEKNNLEDSLSEQKRKLSKATTELHDLKMNELLQSLGGKTATLKTWIRQLTLRYHPDRGGSQEEMKVVNAAYDLLKQLLEH
jgi:hypothetical protein